VSPELALVDPELRRADLARLARQDALLGLTRSPSRPAGAPAAPPSTLDTGHWRIDFADSGARPILTPATVAAPSPVAKRSWPHRVAQLGLLAGLFGAGIIVATMAAHERAADRPELLTRSILNVSKPSTAAVTGTSADDGVVLARELLEQIVQRPSRLPRDFIQPSTGLAKDLQIVCDPASSGEYLCIVRLANKPRETLSVRHGANGFSW
jgi:hypothetical protein